MSDVVSEKYQCLYANCGIFRFSLPISGSKRAKSVRIHVNLYATNVRNERKNVTKFMTLTTQYTPAGRIFERTTGRSPRCGITAPSSRRTIKPASAISVCHQRLPPLIDNCCYALDYTSLPEELRSCSKTEDGKKDVGIGSKTTAVSALGSVSQYGGGRVQYSGGGSSAMLFSSSVWLPDNEAIRFGFSTASSDGTGTSKNLAHRASRAARMRCRRRRRK